MGTAKEKCRDADYQISAKAVKEEPGATRTQSPCEEQPENRHQEGAGGVGGAGSGGSGEEPLAILGMLARQVRLLFRTKALQAEATSAGAIARTLGLPPRVVATLERHAASLSWQQLSRALRCLSRADLAIKTGRATAPAVLSQLVWDLCRA